MRKAFVGGTILDCTGAKPYAEGVLIINGSKIEAVGSRGDVNIPADAETINVAGQVLMPGMINTHEHLGHPDPDDPLIDYPKEVKLLYSSSPEYRHTFAARYGRQELRDGVTTNRILGERDYLDFNYRHAFDSGLLPGPRILTSGPGICTSHGHGKQVSIICDDVDAVRAAVRELLYHEVNVVKLFISGGRRSGVPVQLTTCHFTREEIQAAIDEAHNYGVPVTAHLNGGIGVKYAVEAGIDGIEHGEDLSDEELDLVVKSGTWVGLTILWFFTGLYHKLLGDLFEDQRQKVKRLYDAGVRLTVGNDCVHADHGLARQIDLITRFGIPNMAAILMGTKNAAVACGIESSRGTLEAGKDADVIAIGGDPLVDIRCLRDIRMVMKQGQVQTDL